MAFPPKYTASFPVGRCPLLRVFIRDVCDPAMSPRNLSSRVTPRARLSLVSSPPRGRGAEIIDDGSWFSRDIISQLRVSTPLPPPRRALGSLVYECAMCEQQDRAAPLLPPSVGREQSPRGWWFPPLSGCPRDPRVSPGQTNDGQFTSNRKNFLKLGLK